MTFRRKRHLLILLNVALAAAVVSCPIAAALWSPGQSRGQAMTKAAPRTTSTTQATKGLPSSAYEVIYRRDLRKPLFDVAAVEAPKVEAPKPKLTIQLTGTVDEPDNRFATFRTATGQDKLLSVGDKLEDAELTDVTEDSATVRFHGDLITLKVEKKETP